MPALLVARHVTKHFGGLAAVEAVDLTIDEGEMVGLIGPNGAGKTTFINLITGMERLLLLLDEVMAGLHTKEIEEAMELIRKVHASGVTILVIEHVMKAIMGLCQRIVVLHYGQKVAEGTPQEIVSNRKVIEAYLG